jgi:cell division septum initiation protein DivIVA
MSEQNKNEDPIVGYEWSNEEDVVLKGDEFRKVINIINQYPKQLADTLERLMGETVEMFTEVQQLLDDVVTVLHEEGKATPMKLSELEARIKEMQAKLETPQQSN